MLTITTINEALLKPLLFAAMVLMTPTPLALAADAKTPPLTERLLAALIERNAPTPLFQKADNSWPGGNFTVRVQRAGPAEVVAGGQEVVVEMPLKVILDGAIRNELLQLNLNCKAQFSAPGEVRLKPASATQLAPMRAQIDLVVPPTMADCGGTQLPVESYLRAVMQAQKPVWEAELAKKINDLL